MLLSQSATPQEMLMKSVKLLIAVCGLMLAVGPAYAHDGVSHAPSQDAAQKQPAASVAAPKLQAAMRGLWHGHVVATRDYALAVKANDAKRASRAADAVVANAKQIADAVAGFYGKPAGDQLLGLLAGHWGAVKAMTDAEHSQDKEAGAKAMSTLIGNADQIAAFLAGANPYLPADAVRGLLVAHGGHHATQISQVMKGDLKGEMATWKSMQSHMDVIADALAGAIAKQFPKKAA
jgi:hypothetical protein